MTRRKSVEQHLADALGVVPYHNFGEDCYVALEAEGRAPNCKPVLVVHKGGNVVASVVLSDFCSWAQFLYDGELEHNYRLERGTKRFAGKVKKLRKALGYSYP